MRDGNQFAFANRRPRIPSFSTMSKSKNCLPGALGSRPGGGLIRPEAYPVNAADSAKFKDFRENERGQKKHQKRRFPHRHSTTERVFLASPENTVCPVVGA